jgi:hypothetical protein
MAVVSLSREARSLSAYQAKLLSLFTSLALFLKKNLLMGTIKKSSWPIGQVAKGNYVKSHGLWGWAYNVRH